MARHPTRRRHSSLKFRPFAFSSFSRMVDRLASTSKVKRSGTSKLEKKVISKLHENGLTLDTLEEKIEQSESSSEEDNGGTIQLDFAFFDPKPKDFHGVKILLQKYLDDKQWDLSGFVDLILGQTTVGTVIKVEDEDDEDEDCLYSVVTVLNLGYYKASSIAFQICIINTVDKCLPLNRGVHDSTYTGSDTDYVSILPARSILDIKEFLLKLCKEKMVIGELQILLEEQAQNVGLLVSEHVVNLPPELLPPLYNGLFEEVARAAKDEELRQYFSFKNYLLITRIYKHKNADQQKGVAKGCIDEPKMYIWPEDEIFHKLSSWSFSFPLLTRQANEVKNYRPMGLGMAIEANKIPIFQQELQALISES